MRLCRFRYVDRVQFGFFYDDHVVSLYHAANAYVGAMRESVVLPIHQNMLGFLPPDGEACELTAKLDTWVRENRDKLDIAQKPSLADIELLVPLPRPNKLFLLAGNYARHIEEGGGQAAERAETFPYVFMKPPSTTLKDPGKAVAIPANSPDQIDWELELAVVIGRRARRVKESEALDYVAGYTVINDISDREYRPNPQRKERSRDAFFDWLHGKWHDGFCPCGPCITTPDEISDPQQLGMQLRVNDRLHQDASTSQQIFPVAAVIEFVSNLVTLEPGDIISTGTPHGVGKASGTFLKPGDQIHAWIEKIGTLVSPVVAEAAKA